MLQALPGESHAPLQAGAAPLRRRLTSCSMTDPKAPCTIFASTWALKGLLYHDFGAYVYTIVVLGPFGRAPIIGARFPPKSPSVEPTSSTIPGIYPRARSFLGQYIIIPMKKLGHHQKRNYIGAPGYVNRFPLLLRDYSILPKRNYL